MLSIMFKTNWIQVDVKREEKKNTLKKLKINPGQESEKDRSFIDISVPFLMKFITPLKCASQMHFV